MARRVLPRFSDLIFISIFAGSLLLGARMLNVDSDLGRHLTVGNYILDTHTVPVRDLFSFTRLGDSRPPYEWLAQVAFAAAYRILNLDGVVLLASLVIALSFLVVFLDALHRSRSPIVSVSVTALAALASSLHWLTRPHVLSFLFFAVWIHGLERLRSDEGTPVWQFPVLMLVWANTHGGFVIGLLAWAAYLAGWLWERWRGDSDKGIGIKFLLVGIGSLVASIITPDLWHNWSALLQNRSAYILDRTVETMPPDLGSPPTWPFFLLLLLLLLVVIVALVRRQALAPAHGFLMAALGAMSLLMARNIPFFAIAAAPVMAERLGQALGSFPRWAGVEGALYQLDTSLLSLPWPALALAMAVAGLSYHFIRTQSAIYQIDADVFPVRAADWLLAHPPPGDMFNDFNWGGYLLYRLWPEERVFIDSQTDFYGEGLTRQYEQMILAKGDWRAYLDRYRIQWIIVRPRSALSAALAVDSSWHLIYEDGTAIVLQRTEVP